MVDRLTAMQVSCIRGTCEGMTNAEIARRLGVTPATVSSHLERAYIALGVQHQSSPRTRAAIMLTAHDMQTHASRLLRREVI